MHVNLKIFTTGSSEVASRYKKNPSQSFPLYPELIKAGIRIWVVSGDHDADVPITGTLKWLTRLREQANLPI
jgi:serine carboxypeptidase-like clade 2